MRNLHVLVFIQFLKADTYCCGDFSEYMAGPEQPVNRVVQKKTIQVKTIHCIITDPYIEKF